MRHFNCPTCGKEIKVAPKGTSDVGEIDGEYLEYLTDKPVYCNTKCWDERKRDVFV